MLSKVPGRSQQEGPKKAGRLKSRVRANSRRPIGPPNAPTHPTPRLIARMEWALMFTLSRDFDARVSSMVDGQCDSRTVCERVFLKCILFEYLLRVVRYGSIPALGANQRSTRCPLSADLPQQPTQPAHRHGYGVT